MQETGFQPNLICWNIALLPDFSCSYKIFKLLNLKFLNSFTNYLKRATKTAKFSAISTVYLRVSGLKTRGLVARGRRTKSKTSRERPKSAPYLRLKNSKRTSKYSLLRYRKNPKVEPNWHTRGDTLKFFIHSVANHQKKLKEGHFWRKIFFKSLTMPKKLKGGTLWDFSTSVLSENSKKIEGGTLWEKFFFRKKSLTEPKIL